MADDSSLLKVITPETFDLLLTEFAFRKHPGPHYGSDDGVQERSRLYRIALILYVFVEQEYLDRRFVPVREAFERRIFGTHENEDARAFVMRVKSAVGDLNTLFEAIQTRSRKELTWSRLWLAEAGVDEHNIELLRQFTMLWVDMYATLTELIKGWAKPAQ